jgi:uncharacterized OB-fold protein
VGDLDFSGPRPFVHGEEAAYFDYCRQGELRIQRCRDCKRHVFYPRFVCPWCLADDLEWVRASGRGVVHTFTVQHRAAPDYRGPLPYVIAVIELEEGVRMLSRVVCDPETVRIDMPVTVAWAKIDGDLQVPVFVPQRGT